MATTVTGTSSSDVISVSSATTDYRLEGLEGNDQLTGGSGNDVIVAGPGYDTVRGGGGDDVFIVEGAGQGEDNIFGDGGFDTIQGGAGNDVIALVSLGATNAIEKIDGGAGVNIVSGSASDNVLDFSGTELVSIARIDGGSGNDRITGTSGGDTIVGGAGYDTLRGGDGDDVFVVEGVGQGEDTIFGDGGFDTILGGTGDDAIRLITLGPANAIEKIDGRAGFNIVAGTGSDNAMDFTGVSLVNIALIDAGAGNDQVVGTSGNDTIKGGAGHDTLRGGGGVDTALYDGNAAAYQIGGIGTSQVTVRHLVSGEIDTLLNFAFAQFADTTVSLSGGAQPVVGADAAQTNEDSAVTINVLANDSNGGSGTLSVAGATQGAHGSVTVDADGTLRYTPQANYFGQDSFTYTLSNGTGTATGTVNVTVMPVNDAPLANDDSGFTTPLDTARTFVPSALLGNDSDVEGDALSLVGVGNASGGTVALVNGNVVFTPNTGYSGAAGFDYTLSDGKGGQDTARVSLTVQAANNAPVAGDDSGFSTPRNAAKIFTPQTLLNNDIDANGDALSIIGVGNASGGSVALVNGNVVFTPTASYSGPASFTYTISDGKGGQDSATVNLTVLPNTAPIAGDDSVNVTGSATIAVLGNDSDADGDVLAITGFTQPAHGTLTLNPNNTFTYVPTAGYTGPDSFIYTLSDGSTVDTANVTINVTAQSLTTLTGTSGSDVISVSSATTDYRLEGLEGNDQLTGGSGNDVIVAGPGYDTVRGGGGDDVFIVEGAGQGEDNIFGDGGFDTIQGGTGNDVIALVSLGAANSIEKIDGGTGFNIVAGNASDNVLDFTGVSLVNIARIEGGSGNDRITGGSGSDVIVAGPGYDTVRGGGGDDVFIVEGAGQGEDNIFGDGGFDTIQGGAGNDVIALVSLGTTNAIEKIDGGTGFNIVAGNASDNVLDFTGVSLVNIARIEGGAGNDRITGSAGNDTIKGGAGHDTLRGGGGIDTALYDGNAAAYQIGGIGTSQVTVRHLVSGEIDTLLNFAYAQFADTTVSLSGGAQPVAGADAAQTNEDSAVTIAVLANDSNGGSGTLSVTGATQGSHGSVTVNADGTLRYTPQANYFGQDSFSYTVSNGSATASGTVNVTIVAVNDAPVANDDSGFTTARDTAKAFTAASLLGNDSDVEGDTLSLVGVGNASGGTVALVNGTVVFTPTAGYSGAVGFDYTLSDGKGGQDTARVSLTVQPANNRPSANDDAVSTTGSTTINVLANDSDSDGGTLSILDFTQPLHGTLTLNANNTFTYVPAAGYSGADSFFYTLSDGQGGQDEAIVNIEVTAPPPASGFRQILTDAQEQNWVSLNINLYSDVWTPPELRPPGDGPLSIIGAWSSMAWDPNRGDLIFFGGGHAHYGGNDVYRWRSSTLSWERASLPSQVTDVGDHQETVDGAANTPIGAHTYDNSEFLPIADRWMTWGGAAYNTGGRYIDANGNQMGPYFWNPALADSNKIGGAPGSGVDPTTPAVDMWTNRSAGLPTGSHPGDNTWGFVGGTTAYTQENGKDVIYLSDGNLWKYTVVDVNNPALDRYEAVGIYWEGYGIAHGAAAIDVESQVFVRSTGSANFTYWDLSQAGPGNRNVLFVPAVMNGTFDFAALGTYGMDFDSKRKQFVLWNGDPEVWILKAPDVLSPSGWTLTRAPLPTVPDVPILAETGNTTGVFGKWKYIAEQDIFLGVMDQTRGTVWAYKPNDWQPNNSLPTLALADLSAMTPAAGTNIDAATFVSWADADGDRVHFTFTDRTASAGSGYFRFKGVNQSANVAITVTDAELRAGNLQWVAGQAGTQDQLRAGAGDPFGEGAALDFLSPTAMANLLAQAPAQFAGVPREGVGTLYTSDSDRVYLTSGA